MMPCNGLNAARPDAPEDLLAACHMLAGPGEDEEWRETFSHRRLDARF